MTLQEKLEQIKLFLETLNTEISSTPTTSETLNSFISRPSKQYINSSDILRLFEITKNEYNNILSEVRFCMLALQVDFTVKYKDQDIGLIAKIIEKFKRRNKNTKIGEGSWLIKECIKKYLQHRRDYNNRKDKRLKNSDSNSDEELEDITAITNEDTTTTTAKGDTTTTTIAKEDTTTTNTKRNTTATTTASEDITTITTTATKRSNKGSKEASYKKVRLSKLYYDEDLEKENAEESIVTESATTAKKNTTMKKNTKRKEKCVAPQVEFNLIYDENLDQNEERPKRKTKAGGRKK